MDVKMGDAEDTARQEQEKAEKLAAAKKRVQRSITFPIIRISYTFSLSN